MVQLESCDSTRSAHVTISSCQSIEFQVASAIKGLLKKVFRQKPCFNRMVGFRGLQKQSSIAAAQPERWHTDFPFRRGQCLLHLRSIRLNLSHVRQGFLSFLRPGFRLDCWTLKNKLGSPATSLVSKYIHCDCSTLCRSRFNLCTVCLIQ
jgi:hypothetical protein